jgi:hypothetical protein
LPNLKIRPLFGGTAFGWMSNVTLAAVGSSDLGGTAYRTTGYNTASRSAPAIVPRNQSMNPRRFGS